MGAVSTTTIAGVLAVRRGLARPIGSLTQMGTVRLGKRPEARTPLIKDFVPLASLDDVVFGAWDLFSDNAYEGAKTAGVLEGPLLEQIRPELEAITPLRTAVRLSPFDPLTSLWLHFTARAHYWSGNYSASIAVATQMRQSFPNFRQPYNTLIAAFGQVGRIDDAHAVMADGLARFGDAFRTLMSLPLHELRELRPEDRERMIDGFRKAGLA